jgi:integrase
MAAFYRLFRRKNRRKGQPWDGTYKRGFYARFRRGREEFTLFAGPTREIAHKFALQYVDDDASEKLLGKRKVRAESFRAIHADLAAEMEARHGARTWAKEKGRLDRIVKHFGERKISTLTAADFDTFLSTLRNERGEDPEEGDRALVSGATRNRYRATLSYALRYAAKRNLVRGDPLKDVERDDEEEPSVPWQSHEDIDRLAAKAGPDFGPFLRVLADVGLRRSEALALERRDVDLKRRRLTVRHSKSKRSRTVSLYREKAYLALKALLDSPVVGTNGTSLVFHGLASVHPDGVRYRFRRAAAACGLAEMRVHDLRHGCASRMAMEGVPLPVIQRFMGHASIATTMKYARHAPEGADDAILRQKDSQGEEERAKGTA